LIAADRRGARAPSGLSTELFAQLDRMNEELGYFKPRSSRWSIHAGVVGQGVGEPPEQIAPRDDLAQQRLVAPELVGAGCPQRLGDDAHEKVELYGEPRAALRLIALEESRLREEGSQFLHVAVQENVLPRDQHVVENEDGVIQPRGESPPIPSFEPLSLFFMVAVARNES
jgi:hypothetical protein